MAISIELRRRIVAAHTQGLTNSYEETAEMFGVGRATVSRLLRRHRETGDVLPLPVGGNNPRKVDLTWLREHASQYPDALLSERVLAWEKKSTIKVSITTMSSAMRAIGWTYKKNTRSCGAR